jgi:hypothetical protein
MRLHFVGVRAHSRGLVVARGSTVAFIGLTRLVVTASLLTLRIARNDAAALISAFHPAASDGYFRRSDETAASSSARSICKTLQPDSHRTSNDSLG